MTDFEAAMIDEQVVSDELTILQGRGPFTTATAPADAAVLRFGLGAIGTPATISIDGADRARCSLGKAAGAPEIVMLLAPSAFIRLGSPVPPRDAASRDHLPPELRAIVLALRDCDMTGEARDFYRAAKAIELICEMLRLGDAGVLVPLAAESDLSLADSERIVAARRIIDEQWREKLTLDHIARACGLNRNKLTQGFRETFACTIAEAIAERRLDHARRMLLTTDLPVSSIGYKNGYLNKSSFARAFSRRFGASPSGYRACALAA